MGTGSTYTWGKARALLVATREVMVARMRVNFIILNLSGVDKMDSKRDAIVDAEEEMNRSDADDVENVKEYAEM